MPVPQSGKMSASKLVHYFSGHPAAFGFWGSLPPNNITLNPANKRTDQAISDFQTGIGTAAYATLDTEQLISHIRTTLVDTTASLPGSNSGINTASEVHELLIKIHDILDSAMSKQVCNTTHMLVYLFNYVSSQHH